MRVAAALVAVCFLVGLAGCGSKPQEDAPQQKAPSRAPGTGPIARPLGHTPGAGGGQAPAPVSAN